ncbi:MAG: oleate hydratase, partial [Rhodobacterales bacterium 12-65-15]
MIGGGIGSLAAAAFLIRDAGFTGEAITIFEATSVLGGALDGGGSPETGYSLRGGRMLTSDNYECTWDLFRTIPSIYEEGVSVHDETMAFNKVHVSHAQARLVDSRRARVPVASMGFSMQDRVDLLKVHAASDESLGTSRITDHFAPGFFETEFWQMWATTFAFQPWHSAAELRRYMHRFAMEFGRIETLAGVKRTRFNQYDALVRPLERWLADRGVRFVTGCTVTDIAHAVDRGQFTVTGLTCRHEGRTDTVAVSPDDLVFLQNGSMTDASSLGSMTAPPAKLGKAE